MGFNSVIFLCNDAIDVLKKDPSGWWETTWKHLNTSDCLGHLTSTYGFGYHANGFSAVWNAHADSTAIIIAGQNMVSVACSRYGRVNFNKAEGRAFMLEAWATELGCDLVPSKAKAERALRKAEKALEGPIRTWEERAHRNYLESLVKHLEALIEGAS